ncbi:putative metal-dependent HD superfamily phosphohydrolase [Kribbella sp. VKM Ac-2571]|uniref:outer membrane protein assembly factor BamB family protein n=1 Tax=Kribbella sp. VKM Ac-2571 TaxID=2512222 RepID=UPI00105DB5F1|nr:PQQ-binding-like beta-propeller repeat protein [Kribbella sp. VKM Ac-2571]TDO68202.1 putative metal-dependent HD superfamily phosphohydrolase [Kribbella sp. VKM Ac-2571]
MVELRARWDDLVPGSASLADELVARYVERTRRAYRDHYLGIVLTALDSLIQLSTDPTSVRLAAWFHRAVHEPGGTPSEDAEASARLAERLLPQYGVPPIRIAEVARLIRLTGDLAAPPPDAYAPPRRDANGDVLLDAVNAILASDPSRYAVHTAEVRRDAGDRKVALENRYDEVRELLDGHLYRTQLARQRLSPVARVNLEAELAGLDSELPAPWRGWQQAALTATATFAAIAAAVVAIAASGASWQTPAAQDEAGWPTVALAVLSFFSAPALFRCARSASQRARLIAGAVLAIAVTGLLIAWAQAPRTNVAVGVGLRVPLLISALVLLLVAGAAALVASLLRTRTARYLPARNLGQQLAWLAVPGAVALILLLIVQPLSRSYVLGSNERVEGTPRDAGKARPSVLDGSVAWVSDSVAGTGAEEAIGTRYGVAVPRPSGVVEMLDAATGALRWRYSRSDSDEKPVIAATGNGDYVLAQFADVGYLLLDANTGRRKAAWPGRTRDRFILQTQPLLTGERSGKLHGVDPGGHERWTYDSGDCTELGAIATAETVLTFVSHTCDDRPDEMTALDVQSGKKLWTRTSADTYRRPVVVAGLVVVAEPGGDSDVPAALTAIEPRTGDIRWRWDVPKPWACRTLLNAAGKYLIVVDCPGPSSQENRRSVVTAIDANTGLTAWQTLAPVSPRTKVTVTADGRVISLGRGAGGCVANVVSRAGFRQVKLPTGITCGRDPRAVGNLVLTSGQNTVIALR